MTDPYRGENYDSAAPYQSDAYPPPQDPYLPPEAPYVPPAGSVPPSGGYGQQGPYIPPQGPYGPPPGAYAYPPAPGMFYDPAAPYGRHPMTGEPLSDKSKLVAGLLQLVGLFGLVGFGRIYLGQTGLGIAQLVVGLITCGLGAVIWGIVDAILIFSDKVRDPEGRPLRDGT